MKTVSSKFVGARMRKYELAYDRLRGELAKTGFLWVGTILKQYHQCGHPRCRCRRGGRFRHGPYYTWTRKVAGKTVTRILSNEEGMLYLEWMNNRRKLARTLKKMYALSQRLAPMILRRHASS